RSWMAPVPGDSPETPVGTSMPQGGHPPHHSTSRSDRRIASESLDLEIHGRCFSAVLLDLILDVLPFVERVQSSALDCGDVDEDVLAATLRLNKSIALGRIEPLHRAARHCRSPIDDAQILFWICS